MQKSHVVNFNIDAASPGVTLREFIKEGFIVSAAVYCTESNDDGSVNLSVKNNGGSEIIEPTCLEDWKRREGGDYVSSMKPMGFKGGNTFVIEFTPALGYASIANAEKGQIVFVIEQPDNC